MAVSNLQTLRQVTLRGEIIGSDMLVTEYELLPGCVPSKCGARLALWASAEPLWATEPLETFRLKGDDMNGECLLTGIHLQETHYTVGMVTGKSPQALGSVITFSPGSSAGISTPVGMDVQQSGADALVVTVRGLLGNIPNSYQNWLGLWEGEIVPHEKEGCLVRVPVKSRQSNFTQLMGSLPLKFDSPYTVVYGVGPNWTDIAAALTFQTESY
jgi:hypothetical protein